MRLTEAQVLNRLLVAAGPGKKPETEHQSDARVLIGMLWDGLAIGDMRRTLASVGVRWVNDNYEEIEDDQR